MIKAPIRDAGEKLGGARKDAGRTSTDKTPDKSGSNLLEILWPKPENWSDLVPSLGARRAAMCMVVYENLATKPHSDGHFGLNAGQWDGFYRKAIGMIHDILCTPGPLKFKELSTLYAERMQAYAAQIGVEPKVAKICIYAAGKAHKRTTKHPFSLTPIDDLRAKYLHLWGWGTKPEISDKLSMGALELKDNATGQLYWRSVKGVAGIWQSLDEIKFATEREALVCTFGYVQKILAEQKSTEPKKKSTTPNWVRPFTSTTEMRSGFQTANASGKSERDLIETFGFRGIEFWNWVTQTQRQWFVDAIYDACMDLTQLMGMPTRFASLDGLLGLAYGSRGEGLSRTAAHFERGRWVLHLTKESGPGAFAHEFGHAWDCWMGDRFWRQRNPGVLNTNNEFMSEYETFGFGNPCEIETQFSEWSRNTHRVYSDGKWRWVRESEVMDARRTAYWAKPCELFARAFEILVYDSLTLRGRQNQMLVHGVSEADGQAIKAKGGHFPYPLGAEREAACKLLAKILRAFKAEVNPSLH